MSEVPPDLDLKFMPDWVKEPVREDRYRDYEGESERRPRRDGFGGGRDEGSRGPRARKPGGGGKRPGGDRKGGGGERGREDRPRGGGHDAPRREPAPAPPPQVTVDFLPDEKCVEGIARQIKESHRAYPLFNLARMFLERPERHRVRITAVEENIVLYQGGAEGPVTADRRAAEAAAFAAARSKYYVEETTQGEAPKGNFNNVARCRLTGTLLGPTSHHGYQPALRKLYEERFSRRMSFPDFQREIEVVSDPAAVEAWKEESRTRSVFKTLSAPKEQTPDSLAEVEVPADDVPRAGEEQASDSLAEVEVPADDVPRAGEEQTPDSLAEVEAPAANVPRAGEEQTFDSLAEVERHFREHYLEAEVQTGRSFEMTGAASRALPERGLFHTVREAWEKERAFPGQIVNPLRGALLARGLHLFKHKKRMQYMTAVKPARVGTGDGAFSPHLARIVEVVRETPRCSRKALADKLLGDRAEDPELPNLKAALAAALHWLVGAGHIIEFHDGILETPLPPKPEEPRRSSAVPPPKVKEASPPPESAAPAEEVPTNPQPSAEPPPSELSTLNPQPSTSSE